MGKLDLVRKSLRRELVFVYSSLQSPGKKRTYHACKVGTRAAASRTRLRKEGMEAQG